MNKELSVSPRTLLKRANELHDAAHNDAQHGDFRAAVETARQAATQLIALTGSSDRAQRSSDARRIVEAWEKSFWQLEADQKKAEMTHAGSNGVLASRTAEIKGTLSLLSLSSQAHYERDYSKAVALTHKAVKIAIPGTAEQERAIKLWKIYALDLCEDQRKAEAYIAKKTPALAPHADSVANYVQREVGHCKKHREGFPFHSKTKERLSRRLAQLLARTSPS